MEGEIEEDRFLFLGSEYNLMCIDLKKTEEKHGNRCSVLSFDPPMAEVAWSTNIHGTTSDWIPFGMSSTQYNFKAATSASASASSVLVACSSSSSASPDILLIGGEIQHPSSPYVSVDASREIYKLVPEITSVGDMKDIKIEVADLDIPRMYGAKAGPIVEEIREQWHCSETMTGYLVNRLPMTVPLGLPCFGADASGRPLYVGFSLTVEPCAYLISTDGTILATQSVEQIIYKDLLPDPSKSLDRNVLIPLKSKTDDIVRMCACSLIYCDDFPDYQALVVSIFSAKIALPSQQLILKMINGELQDVYNHPAYGSFVEVFVEKKFLLRAPQLGYSFNGPALML